MCSNKQMVQAVKNIGGLKSCVALVIVRVSRKRNDEACVDYCCTAENNLRNEGASPEPVCFQGCCVIIE